MLKNNNKEKIEERKIRVYLISVKKVDITRKTSYKLQRFLKDLHKVTWKQQEIE